MINDEVVSVRKEEDAESILNRWLNSRYSSPNHALRTLSKVPGQVEAAAALFFCAYDENVGDYGPGGSLEDGREGQYNILEMIEESEVVATLKEKYKREVLKQIEKCDTLIEFRDRATEDYSFLFGGRESSSSRIAVKMFATAALTCCKADKLDEHDNELYGLLRKAFEDIRARKFKEAINYRERREGFGGESAEDIIGFVSCLACAVVCNSFAHIAMKEEEPDFEAAFIAFVEGTNYLESLDRTNWGLPLVEDASSCDEVDNILDAWDGVKKNKRKIVKWQDLVNRMRDFERHSYEIVGDEADSIIGERYGYECRVFFPQQLAFCEGLMSHEELLSRLEQERKERDVKRMTNDFFPNSWAYLEEQTKKRVLQAEGNRYDGREKYYAVDSIIEDYEVALESELHAVIFKNDKVRQAIKAIIEKCDNKEYKKKFGLETTNVDRDISVGDMSKILTCIGKGETFEYSADLLPIKEYIKGLPNPASDNIVSKDFTRDFRDIIYYRNKSIHDKKMSREDILINALRLRKKILGIGHLGYLPMLAEAKRQIWERRKDLRYSKT